MEKKNFIIWILLFATIATAIEVDYCTVGFPCTIRWGPTVNGSNESQLILGQICNISLYNNSSDLVHGTPIGMLNDTTAWHTFQWTPNTTGRYQYSILCEVGSDSTMVGGVVEVQYSDMFNYIPIILMLLAGAFLAIAQVFNKDKSLRILFLFMTIITFYFTVSILIHYDNPVEIERQMSQYYIALIGGTMFVVLYISIWLFDLVLGSWMQGKENKERREGEFF